MRQWMRRRGQGVEGRQRGRDGHRDRVPRRRRRWRRRRTKRRTKRRRWRQRQWTTENVYTVEIADGEVDTNEMKDKVESNVDTDVDGVAEMEQ